MMKGLNQGLSLSKCNVKEFTILYTNDMIVSDATSYLVFD